MNAPRRANVFCALIGGWHRRWNKSGKSEKAKTDMKYYSAKVNSARERNNKPIQVVSVNETDTTNNVHTIG